MHPYDWQGTGAAITNTTTEGTLYSKVITGGDLGANGTADLVIAGRIYHNTTDGFYIRVKFGGLTFLQSADTIPLGTGTSTVPFELRVQLWNLGSASAQAIWATYNVWNPSVQQGGAGLGNFTHSGTADTSGIMANYTGTVNTASNQTLEVTIQWSAASANNSIDRIIARMLLGKN